MVGVSELAPSSDQRKPSIKPTAGLRLNRKRQRSGTRLVEYTTGLAYIQTWIRNGKAYMKSRYCTFSAESQRLTPTASTAVSSKKKGMASRCQVSGTR